MNSLKRIPLDCYDAISMTGNGFLNYRLYEQNVSEKLVMLIGVSQTVDNWDEIPVRKEIRITVALWNKHKQRHAKRFAKEDEIKAAAIFMKGLPYQIQKEEAKDGQKISFITALPGPPHLVPFNPGYKVIRHKWFPPKEFINKWVVHQRERIVYCAVSDLIPGTNDCIYHTEVHEIESGETVIHMAILQWGEFLYQSTGSPEGTISRRPNNDDVQALCSHLFGPIYYVDVMPLPYNNYFLKIIKKEDPI